MGSEKTDCETGCKDRPSRKAWIQQRYVLAVMSFLSLTMQYSLKVNLSVAIVAMVKSTNNTTENESETSETEKDGVGEFDWDMKTQGNILAAYFYGYVVTQFFGGYSASRWGGRHVVGLGLAVSGVLALISPLAARQGAWPLIAVRALEGAFSGVILPALHVMFSLWFPEKERSSVSGSMFSGLFAGTVIGIAVSGPLSKWPMEGGGWPMVFYFFGAVTLVMTIPWWLLCYSNPKEHPMISDEEKEYILGAVGKENEIRKTLPIPWKHILTDIHVWTGIIFHMGTGWVVYTMLTELPTYMKKVLHFDIEKLSFLSALPSLLSWISSILSGILSQWLRRKGYLSHLTTYKVFNGLSALGATACMVAITQIGYRPNVIVLLLAITGVCSGIFFGGSYVNHLDLAINYAGPISGILHTMINLSGMMIAPIVAAVVHDKHTIENWSNTFYMVGGISAATFLLYLIFGSVEERPWNRVENIQVNQRYDNLGLYTICSFRK